MKDELFNMTRAWDKEKFPSPQQELKVMGSIPVEDSFSLWHARIMLNNSSFMYNLICHVTKVKASTLAHSLADVICVLNICLKSNTSIKLKENIFYTQ